MPYRVPSPVLSNFLTNHTRPISVPGLLDSCQCPICHNQYSEPDPDYVHPLHPAGTPEYPVQIYDCGECPHIFGRLCLERHIRARQPWSHRCPICRAEWFPAPVSRRERMLGRIAAALEQHARAVDDEEVEDALSAVVELLRDLMDELQMPGWI
ncbi:hypothetical protein CC78DRAFT_536390 [Lojkania enalia]|uniref:RING-type domain-containing protein n=1 Tax=Lojkania enalia TaxID=147567 RepID=A0A9P4MZK9_9PLEO|nr:hypothetical protein CC78DRAFT_536390 [Didymosphaeria enalia]